MLTRGSVGPYTPKTLLLADELVPEGPAADAPDEQSSRSIRCNCQRVTRVEQQGGKSARHVLHSEVEVELVLLPSSAAAADPPMSPRPRMPLLVVEVDVEPALLDAVDWRGDRLEPVLETGRARALLAKRAMQMAVIFIMAVGLVVEDLGRNG